MLYLHIVKSEVNRPPVTELSGMRACVAGEENRLPNNKFHIISYVVDVVQLCLILLSFSLNSSQYTVKKIF